MSCELCHGSKVVQQPLGSYGFTFAPCPNCTNDMKGPVEFWKKLPDSAGIEVSSFGRVRSVNGHYYKGSLNKDGYQQVTIPVNGKFTNKLVHRLVAQTFIPNPNNYPEVNHKDSDRTNNSASNLEWCTRLYNMQYREKFGEAAGHPLFAVNLSTLEVSWILSQREAGRVLGLSHGSVGDVISGRRKQACGYWFVNYDDNAVDITKRKLHEIGKTGLKAKQGEDTASTNFVRQVLAEYALERKLAYDKQKLA